MRKLTDNEKNLVLKIAKLIDCKWFEFSHDNTQCIWDNEEKKQLSLEEGLMELYYYNSDCLNVLTEKNSLIYELVEENTKIKLQTKNNVNLKNSLIQQEFISKYNSIEEIRNLLTKEEIENFENLINEVVQSSKTKTLNTRENSKFELMKNQIIQYLTFHDDCNISDLQRNYCYGYAETLKVIEKLIDENIIQKRIRYYLVKNK